MRHRISPSRSPHTLLLALILVTNLVIGSLVVGDYGESRDEHLRYDYAERSLAAYSSGKRMNVDEKGPAYVMLARLGAGAMRLMWGKLSAIDAWHFMHFLSFLSSVWFLYQICFKYMRPAAALGATLLFNTQPLLWGHAWMNPKDIPFMAFFLGSVALGMNMAPAERASVPALDQGYGALLRQDWRLASPRRRWLLTGAAALALAVLLVLLLTAAATQGWITEGVRSAYAGEEAGLFGWLFARLAEQAGSVPVESYVEKGLALYRRLVGGYAALVPVIWLACAAVLFPGTRDRFWQGALRPFIAAALGSLLDWRVLLAAFFLGFASAIRALGPAAGLLVAFYCLAKWGRRASPGLLTYFLVAGLVTVALWPALWSAPVGGYLSAFGEASDFPWEGKVMFAGVDYPVSELPRSYLPALLGLQLTEPAILLTVLGFLLAMLEFRRVKTRRPELALAALWFWAPLLAAVALMPTVYDNFRQFLFIVPPLFIFAGMGLQAIFDRVGRLGSSPGRTYQTVRVVAGFIVLAALLLPGLYGDVRLHPYQYVYYNQLAGGVGGAFRRYELDYWTTSYKEATEYLNANAPAGARISVWGADHIVRRYAREDLEIIDFAKADAPLDFAVVSTRHNKDLELYPQAPVVFQTGRDGAVFSVVKRLDAQP